jgi:hypothetical protein
MALAIHLDQFIRDGVVADQAEVRRLAAAGAKRAELARLAEVQERITATDRRLAEICVKFAPIANQEISNAEVSAALASLTIYMEGRRRCFTA